MNQSSNRAEHDQRSLARLLTALFIVEASIWVPGALGLSLFWSDLDERSPWISTGVLLLGWALWGWLLISGLWIGIWPRVRVGILGLVLLVAVAGPLIRHYWGTLSVDGRIAVMRWRYEQVAREWEARAGAGPLAGPPVQRTREGYLVDIGPPMRLAVPLPGSPIAGRWHALVYDPSDFVLGAQRFAADGSNWNDPELAPVKRLFGGPLRRCKRYDGPWFMCGFGEPWATRQASPGLSGLLLPTSRRRPSAVAVVRAACLTAGPRRPRAGAARRRDRHQRRPPSPRCAFRCREGQTRHSRARATPLDERVGRS